jgi:ribosomal protein L31E
LERYKQSKVFKLRKFLSKNLQVSKIWLQTKILNKILNYSKPCLLKNEAILWK